MSTREHEGPESQTTAFGIRPLWFFTGSLLWMCALGSALALWLTDRERNTAASEPAVANSAVAVTTDRPEALSAADEDEDGAPEPGVLTLPVNASSGDGQVIDLSELMRNTQPAQPEAMWDPNGVEDFAFTNIDGRTITKADLLGRPWAICFVFTKCLGPCPTVTKQLHDLQMRLKEYDVRLVTLTVDPARDTPEVLANYAKLNGADPEKWYFLTGDQSEIYGLIHRSFRMPVQETFGPDRQEGFEIIHSTNVMLVDANGVIRGKFNAAKDAEMSQLRRELQSLAIRMPVAAKEPVIESEAETPLADSK
jgi:cytochrome oxidase Cu insertion factor (SCO1/SenC/PrrC family)